MNLPIFQSIPDYYQSIVEDGFKAYPARLENYKRYQSAKEKSEILEYRPIKLDVENVSRCNYHCIMCQVSDWKGRKRADDMDLEGYKALVDSEIGLIQVKLQGMGEPTLDKNYAEMIKYARERKLWVRSITNGSLLDRNENYRRILDADINELFVSVDGASAQSYETIRRGGKFSKVLKNAELLNSYGRSLQNDRTLMWVVVQRDNIHELSDFPRIASDMGFRRMTFSLDLHYFGKASVKERNSAMNASGKLSEEVALELVEIGRQLGVEVSFWIIYSKFSSANKDRLCPWPFERLYVSSDMRIVPCSIIATPEVKDLGNAATLDSEWNAEHYRDFRRSHLTGEIPSCCKLCYEN